MPLTDPSYVVVLSKRFSYIVLWRESLVATCFGLFGIVGTAVHISCAWRAAFLCRFSHFFGISNINNKKIGKPPALPVDSQSLTITGIRGKSHDSEPLKVQEKETSNVRRTKFKPHEVRMQVSHCMDTEVSKEGDICRTQEIPGGNISRSCSAKRM
jgi:hypothetical protein